MLAKNLGARKTIARIDNLEYLETENESFFRKMGIDSLIYPETDCRQEVLMLLHETGQHDFMEFSGKKLALYVQKLDEKAPIVNRTLRK
jgi:trk system potassium uptake protein TrkA